MLKTVLALLQLSGFVETVRSASDLRQRYYKPTARIDVFIQRWLDYAVATLDLLEPEMQRARMLRDDPDFANRFFIRSGRTRLAGEPLVNYMPEYIDFFGRREGATSVLLQIMLAHVDGNPVPSQREIAKRFHISKAQVSALLAEGEAAGHFEVRDGMVRPTAALVASHHRWISIELAFYAQNMQPAVA